MTWGEDADDRIIPVIPRQRASEDVPVCCDRAMTWDGLRWVCRECRGCFQPEVDR